MITAVRSRVDRHTGILLGVIASAWVLAVGAEVTGRADAVHHHELVEGSLPLLAALGLFLVAWQLHIAAMMLPSSLPLMTLFSRAASTQPRAGTARAAFLGGYAAVWSAFGAAALVADAAVHEAATVFPWLEPRSGLALGSLLVLAGAFQFTDLKDRCLTSCRNPAAYLMPRYRRGVREAFRLGRGHGLFCLGCCWALMLVMVAVGISNLAWMAPMTAVMIVEKISRRGKRWVRPIGVGLIGLGAVLLLAPSWVPTGVM